MKTIFQKAGCKYMIVKTVAGFAITDGNTMYRPRIYEEGECIIFEDECEKLPKYIREQYKMVIKEYIAKGGI